MQNISESVFSIIKDYGQMVQDGKLTADEARTQALTRIKTIHYGKDDCLNINQTNSVMMMHPIETEMNGKDMPSFTDSTGDHLSEEVSRVGKSGGGFVDYPQLKPGVEIPQPEKSYALYYRPWDWYLVTGTYMGDIETVFHASLVKALGLLFSVDSSMTVVTVTVTCSLQYQLGNEPAYIARIADRVAADNPVMPVETHSGDRDSMLYAMAQMQRELTGTIGNVKSSAGPIASAAKRIAAGNASLSQRTEQQALSLEKAASNMEELTSIVKQNINNARQANTLAANASGIATKGRKVVGCVVETMSGINESSREIVDIIGMIEGIAFQTDILALSAAVEAACADEQGRGLVVMAGEARSLVRRSVSTTKEIKDLIGDSVDRAQNGSALVEKAGVMIQDVVTAVKRATDIMGGISTTSDEQSSGVERVNQAVNQIDEITQQNVALVEQATAATLLLKEWAQLPRTAVGHSQV